MGQQYAAIHYGNTMYNIFVLIYIKCLNNINKTAPSKTNSFFRLTALNMIKQ